MTTSRFPQDITAVRLEAMAASLVGATELEVTRTLVSKAMLREALQRSGGNYTHAGKLLGIQRQAVQQMVTRFGMVPWIESLRHERRTRECRLEFADP